MAQAARVLFVLLLRRGVWRGRKRSRCFVASRGIFYSRPGLKSQSSTQTKMNMCQHSLFINTVSFIHSLTMLRKLPLVCLCLLPSAVAFSTCATTATSPPCIARRTTSWTRSKAAFAATEPEDNPSLVKSPPPPPPPPPFQPKPLALILSAGVFLFPNSVAPANRPMAQALLQAAQRAMRADPVLTMELGQTMETGGVYASTFAVCGEGVQQLVLQFQIEGGNAWAQGIAYGICHAQSDSVVQLVSLQVANMDASMNGIPYDVPLPTATTTTAATTSPPPSSVE